MAALTFRVAFELPVVSRVAVGTGSAAHLADLVDAVGLPVDDAVLTRYRQLIRGEPSGVPRAAP